MTTVKLHSQRFGQGDPVILLHGLFGSSDNWASLSRRFGDHFQVFALDQRNHGRSPHHPEMNYPLMAEDVREFIRGQHLGTAAVLGHSMGAKTAMHLALHHPHLVNRLVVVDMAPRSYSPRHARILEGMRSLRPAEFHTRKEMEQFLAPWVPDTAVRQFLLKNIGRDSAGGFTWKIGLEEIYRNYSRLGEATTGDRPFDRPTLFIRGEHSDYLVEEDREAVRKLFPRAEWTTIAGAGHWVHADAPDLLFDCVLNFLKGRGAD